MTTFLHIGDVRPFPRQRIGFEFIGQTWIDADSDIPDQSADSLQKKEAPMKCRKDPEWKWG